MFRTPFKKTISVPNSKITVLQKYATSVGRIWCRGVCSGGMTSCRDGSLCSTVRTPISPSTIRKTNEHDEITHNV